MPEPKRKRASPAARAGKKETLGRSQKKHLSSSSRKRATSQYSKSQPDLKVVLAENERLSARVRELETELKRVRPESRAPNPSTPRIGGPGDEGLAEALRKSGMKAEQLLTHYNHGRGRIVLVPESGDRVVVEMDAGQTEKEAP